MNPNAQAIGELMKSELQAAGKRLQLDMEMSQRKSESKQVIMDHVADECLTAKPEP